MLYSIKTRLQLDIGDLLHVSDLKVTDKVEILTDPQRVLVTVVPPTELKEPEPEEEELLEGEEEAAEPELIGEEKAPAEAPADAPPPKEQEPEERE